MVLCCETEFNTEEIHTLLGYCHNGAGATLLFPHVQHSSGDKSQAMPEDFAVGMLTGVRLRCCCSPRIGPWDKFKSISQTQRQQICPIQEVPRQCVKKKHTLLLVSVWHIPASYIPVTKWWVKTFHGHLSVWVTYHLLLLLLLWFLPQGPQGRYRQSPPLPNLCTSHSKSSSNRNSSSRWKCRSTPGESDHGGREDTMHPF